MSELPDLATWAEREQVLAAAWLMSLRSPRTRRAYFTDLHAWLAWLAERGVDVLAASRVHVDLWVGQLDEHGVEASTVRRLAMTALSGPGMTEVTGPTSVPRA